MYIYCKTPSYEYITVYRRFIRNVELIVLNNGGRGGRRRWEDDVMGRMMGEDDVMGKNDGKGRSDGEE